MKTCRFRHFVSLLLVAALIISQIGCSNNAPTPELSSPDEHTITETVEIENTITETVVSEYITSEVYLEEITVAEDKIIELLLEENTIDEVLLCKTIYVPQENLLEFAQNSQTTQLFGNGVNLSSLLTKIAIGTGVIVTLVVLKKVNLSEPLASVVIAAADKSLEFAKNGAIIGSLFGGLSGVAGEVDSSKRSSAVLGFAMATAGFILATVSLVTAIPSGGMAGITAAAGVKLVIAGIGTLASLVGLGYQSINLYRTFTTTDGIDIDWDNIDWEKVGASAAQQAINSGADGYMWGSVIGAVYGGAEGYDYYHKYNTPYSSYKSRIDQTPTNGGKWTGKRGESEFVLDEPIKLADGRTIDRVTYRNGVPDFSPYQVAQVKIPHMTNVRRGKGMNFEQADKALAEIWTKMKFNKMSWTARTVEEYRVANNLVWHEMNNMETMQLIPYDVNHTFGHLGGVGEYNAMIGEKGVEGFD